MPRRDGKGIVARAGNPDTSLWSKKVITSSYRMYVSRRILLFPLAVLCLIIANTLAGCAFFKHGTSAACHTDMVAMRDGVKLATDITLPAASGRHPVVIMRTPYGATAGPGCASGMAKAVLGPFARDGYVVISQDVRGTSRSEGVFAPFTQEQNDGYDTVEWAAAQPWSDGHVSMTSLSYLGATQWQAALTKPLHLVAITPSITAPDYHDDWTYRNGVFDPLFNLAWVAQAFVPDQITRSMKAQGAAQAEIDAKLAAWKQETADNATAQWMAHLPLDSGVNETLAEYAPFYFEWLKHPTYDSFWANIDVGRHYQDIAIPALISGAWYDLFAVGTIDSYLGMRDHAGSETARQGTMLAMSWGGHATLSAPLPGQITWGPDPSDKTLAKRFIDHYARDVDNGIENEPRVQLTVLVPPDKGTEGSSFLYKTTDFPAPDAKWTRFYLASGGHANTRRGDGRLEAGHSGGAEDRFTYDPAHPVPTHGGNDGGFGAPGGAFDQSGIETRDDVLVYQSAPLADDMAAIGPVTVSFWAATSAKDTDFTAKLVDVHPDGFAHNVVDRIARASLRRGSREPPEPIQPGRLYPYTINLGGTATIFRKGHRVLLEISSSNFPHYARNLNTGKSNEDTVEMVKARQTIVHDERHPSYLELAVEPGVAAP
jgi:putative CocE/NonD family hydrolase